MTGEFEEALVTLEVTLTSNPSPSPDPSPNPDPSPSPKHDLAIVAVGLATGRA